MVLDDIFMRVDVVDITLSFKRAHGILVRVNFIRFASQFMVNFFSIFISKHSIIINMLLTLVESGINAVLLVVVVLEGDDVVLVQIHNVFHLSQGKWQITLSPLFVGLKLSLEID